MNREQQLAAGMVEPYDMEIEGIKMRPYSYGTMQLAYMLDLGLVTGEIDQASEAETLRQVCTFAWMQSAPKHDVLRAVREKRVEEEVLLFGMDLPLAAADKITDEIKRVASMVQASSVRVESKFPSSAEDAPGKS